MSRPSARVPSTVKIIKDGEYLAYIDIHNEKPIRPKVGVVYERVDPAFDMGEPLKIL